MNDVLGFNIVWFCSCALSCTLYLSISTMCTFYPCPEPVPPLPALRPLLAQLRVGGFLSFPTHTALGLTRSAEHLVRDVCFELSCDVCDVCDELWWLWEWKTKKERYDGLNFLNI